jgi:hypothetical protein
MDVKEIVTGGHKFAKDKSVLAEGWLVIIRDTLYLMEHNFPQDETESWPLPPRYEKEAMLLRITNQDWKYLLLGALPKLGGGHSSLFYKAQLTGWVTLGNVPEFEISELCVQQDRSNDRFDKLEMSLEIVETERAVSHDGYDFYKELYGYSWQEIQENPKLIDQIREENDRLNKIGKFKPE